MRGELTLDKTPAAAAARAIALVWRSWRALTGRHFRYAALAGIALGLFAGTSDALKLQGSPWESLLLQGFVPMLVLAFVLLLCLTVAANVQPRRWPRWMPFVVAATVAVAITMTVDSIMWYFILRGRGSPVPDLAQASLVYLQYGIGLPWQLALLGALSYMHAMDAWRRTQALRQLQLDGMRASRQTFEARLQALQARVDPRFLFETLAAIEAGYAASAARGQRLLDALIVFLRAALPSLKQRSSSLARELALARAWLEITQARRDERLAFSIELSSGPAAQARMPPMVLLPLVQHAASPAEMKSAGRVTLAITVDATPDRIHIGIAAAEPATADHLDSAALDPIRDRLQSLYGSAAAVDCRGTRRDFRIDLSIPHELADRDHR